MMYDELVKNLRSRRICVQSGGDLEKDFQLMKQAADAIEELLDFAHFVASEVVVTDEEWDNNMLVFPEVASRKLNKLGIVKKDGAFWGYEPPKEG